MTTDLRILALDTEDDQHGDPTILNLFDGQTHTTLHHQDTEALRLAAWNVLTLAGRRAKRDGVRLIVWATNIEYDLLNLCGPWVGKMTTLQYRGAAGLIRASWQDAPITFLDTYKHWPMSVAQMGDYLGLKKTATGYGQRDITVSECRRDTEITHVFTVGMLGEYRKLGLDVRSTLPGMAMQLYTNDFAPGPLPQVRDDLRQFFRRGYYGGRTECFHLGLLDGPIYHYDVNSLFPSVMRDGIYPDLWAQERDGTVMDLSREGMAWARIKIPECYYPPVPMRGPTDLVYPWGTLNGVWTYPELRRVLADGGQILHVSRAVEYPPLPVSPFQRYVEFCYLKRMEARKGSLEDRLWKLLLNTLYGKFGQGDELTFIHQDREITRPGKASRASNVIWAAYTTALARMRLLDEFRSCGDGGCHYTDTDSIFTSTPRPTSTDLGAMKEEGIYEAFEPVGNKCYVVRYARGADCPDCHEPIPCVKHGAERFKAKGVKAEAASDFIRTGRAIFRRPIRYRESRRAFLRANEWVDVEKVREGSYTKRRVLPSGATEPWEWKQYLALAAHGTLG